MISQRKPSPHNQTRHRNHRTFLDKVRKRVLRSLKATYYFYALGNTNASKSRIRHGSSRVVHTTILDFRILTLPCYLRHPHSRWWKLPHSTNTDHLSNHLPLQSSSEHYGISQPLAAYFDKASSLQLELPLLQPLVQDPSNLTPIHLPECSIFNNRPPIGLVTPPIPPPSLRSTRSTKHKVTRRDSL